MGYERSCCGAAVGFLEPSPFSLLAPRGRFQIALPPVRSNFAVASARVRWSWQTKLNGDVSPYDFNLSLGLFTVTSHPAHGLWGQAKFQSADSAPFAALVIETLFLPHGAPFKCFMAVGMFIFSPPTVDGFPHRPT